MVFTTMVYLSLWWSHAIIARLHWIYCPILPPISSNSSKHLTLNACKIPVSDSVNYTPEKYSKPCSLQGYIHPPYGIVEHSVVLYHMAQRPKKWSQRMRPDGRTRFTRESCFFAIKFFTKICHKTLPLRY